MTDLVLTFTPYAIAVVGLVSAILGAAYLWWRWHNVDPRPGYIYDREKERLPL